METLCARVTNCEYLYELNENLKKSSFWFRIIRPYRRNWEGSYHRPEIQDYQDDHHW